MENPRPTRREPTYQELLQDKNGLFLAFKQDLCDCLNENCDGCQLRCTTCR